MAVSCIGGGIVLVEETGEPEENHRPAGSQ